MNELLRFRRKRNSINICTSNIQIKTKTEPDQKFVKLFICSAGYQHWWISHQHSSLALNLADACSWLFGSAESNHLAVTFLVWCDICLSTCSSVRTLAAGWIGSVANGTQKVDNRSYSKITTFDMLSRCFAFPFQVSFERREPICGVGTKELDPCECKT